MEIKKLIVFFVGCFSVLSSIAQYSGCAIVPAPTDHSSPYRRMPCWGVREWLARREKEYAPEQCDPYNGYVLMFEDNFDGNSLDIKKWASTADGNSDWVRNSPNDESFIFNPLNTTIPDLYTVSNGTLKLKAIKRPSNSSTTFTLEQKNFWSDCDPNIKTLDSYYYDAMQLISRKLFTTGKYEVRCKLNYYTTNNFQKNINIAPLWLLMPGFGDFYNEIDIELWNKGGTWDNKFNSVWWSFITKEPGSSVKRCIDSNNNHCDIESVYDEWHTFTIEWDSHKIKWSVDGKHFRSIYRTYNLSNIPINECNGPSGAGYKHRNDMFPTFTNMNILCGVGSGNKNFSNGPQEYLLEIDYIKAYKKISCDKSIHISEYKPFTTTQSKPDYYSGVQTPQVITAGTITVAGNGANVHVKRQDFWFPNHLDLYASNSITILPGFYCNPSENITNNACPGPELDALQNGVKYGDGFFAEAVPCPVSGGGNTRVNDDNLVYEEDNSEFDEMKYYDYISKSSFTNFSAIEDTLATNMSENPIKQISLEVYPNPLHYNNNLFIVYSIPELSDVKITILSMEGIVLNKIKDEKKEIGIYSLIIPNIKYSAGTYIVKIEAGGFSEMAKFVLI